MAQRLEADRASLAERAREEAGVPWGPWSAVRPEFLNTQDQGEHVIILGKTGRGKTTLMLDMMDGRAEQPEAGGRAGNAAAVGLKARDSTLRESGWPVIREWPPTHAMRHPNGINRGGARVVFWPPYSAPSTARRTTRPRLTRFLDAMMAEGAWCIGFDEIAYVVETLGMRAVVDEFWNSARSSDITLYGASQRPSWMAKSGITQIGWAAIFSTRHREDRLIIGDVLGERQRYFDVIGTLGDHEFLLVHLLDDRAVVTELGT